MSWPPLDIVIFTKVWLHGTSLFDWHFFNYGKLEHGFIIIIFLDFILFLCFVIGRAYPFEVRTRNLEFFKFWILQFKRNKPN